MAHLLDDVPIKTPIYKGFSMAMLNNQMVKRMVALKWYSQRVDFDTCNLT